MLADLQDHNAAMRRALAERERLLAEVKRVGMDPPRSPPTRREIAQSVAHERGLTLGEILSPCRTKRIAHARHEAMWRMRQETRADGSPRWSLPQIGQFFGRDHSTVLHGVREHEKRRGAA